MGKHPITSRVFCLVERFLPLDRVIRTESCIAFRHPRPTWDPHILVVPTTPFPEIGSPKIPLSRQFALIWEMANVAGIVVRELELAGTHTMIINGGVRQDIGQVHGHLTPIPPPTQFTVEITLQDPSLNDDAWQTLLAAWKDAATRRQNGYSLIVEVSSTQIKTAWLTQTTAEPDQGNTDAILEKGRATCA